MRHFTVAVVFVLALFTTCAPALAAPAEMVDLGPAARVLDTGRCPADRAAAVARLPAACFGPWSAVREPLGLTYFNPARLWMRVAVPGSVDPARRWYLHLSWMVFSGQVTVFTAAGRPIGRAVFGSDIPVRDRAVRTYDVRAPLPALRPGDVLVLHTTSVRAEFETLELWTGDGLAALDARTGRQYLTPLAFINGMLFAMAMFNLLLFALLRQRSFLLFSLAMLAMIGFQEIQSGTAWTAWWPALSVRDDAPAYVAWVVYFALVTAFARSFLDLRRCAAWADDVLLAAFAFVVVDALLYVLFPGLLSVLGVWELLDPISTAAMIVALVGAGIVAALHGVASARYYAIGFAGAAIGLFVADAADYGLIAAPFYDDLWSAVGVAWEAIFLAFALAERIRQAERDVTRLSEFAYLDQLTGIANRRAFDEALEREWRRGTRTAQPLSLLLFDIDHFKAFNDRYGHQQGDEALRTVAGEIARAARRPGDFAARYGGEEFALILAETPRDGAAAAAEAVRRAVAALGIAHGDEHLTISAGCATMVPYDGENSAVLISFADGALYEAKAAGRDCTVAAAPDVRVTPGRTTGTALL